MGLKVVFNITIFPSRVNKNYGGEFLKDIGRGIRICYIYTDFSAYQWLRQGSRRFQDGGERQPSLLVLNASTSKESGLAVCRNRFRKNLDTLKAAQEAAEQAKKF